MTLQKFFQTILFAIIAILLLVGVFFLGAFWKEKQIIFPDFGPNDGLIDNQQESPVQEEPSEEYIQAVSNRDEKACETLKEGEKTLCKRDIIVNIANEKKDKAECDKLQDQTEISDCKDGITFNIAVEGDILACNSLSDEITKQSCILNAWNTKAINEKNPAICDNISEKMNQDLCKENVKETAAQQK